MHLCEHSKLRPCWFVLCDSSECVPVVVRWSSHVVGPCRGHVHSCGPVWLAAPGHVASANGVLWSGREMDSVLGGRCDMTIVRARESESPRPSGRCPPTGQRLRVVIRVGDIELPADIGPSAPARVLRGSRPITGMTLPTQAGVCSGGGDAAVGLGPSRRAAIRRCRARGVGRSEP